MVYKKVLCYICIFTLLLCQYTISNDIINELIKALKISKKKLITCFRYVGAKYESNTIQLKAPLKLLHVQSRLN